MRHDLRSKLLSALMVGFVLTSAAEAQFGAYNPAARRAYGTGVRRGGYGYPGGYGGGYPGYYVPTRSEGYLNGISNVIDSQGQYGKDYQQARMMNQQSEQAKIKTRKAMIEEKMWEKSLIPTSNETIEKNQREALRRTMNDPPLTEIINGTSLNVLLVEQKKQLAQGMVGPSVELDPYVLAKINVTASTSGGNIGIFSNGGNLNWPFPLRAMIYNEDRMGVDALAKKAFTEARTNAVTPETVNQLTTLQNRMVTSLNEQVHDMPLGDYMTAKRYLDQLERGITALKAPSTGNYFNGKWSANGRNVAEMVANMSKEGLTFAPASRGDEAAYRSLHQSMVSYEYGVDARFHVRTSPPPKK